MASKWHREIQKILRDYGNELKKKVELIKVGGHGQPFQIPHTNIKNVTVQYKPDVYYVYRKKNLIIVFEVIDSESNDQIHADVVKSLLVGHVNTAVALVFITKDEKRKKEVRNEAEVIYKQLTNVFNQPPVKPFQVRVVDISPEELEESLSLIHISEPTRPY